MEYRPHCHSNTRYHKCNPMYEVLQLKQMGSGSYPESEASDDAEYAEIPHKWEGRGACGGTASKHVPTLTSDRSRNEYKKNSHVDDLSRRRFTHPSLGNERDDFFLEHPEFNKTAGSKDKCSRQIFPDRGNVYSKSPKDVGYELHPRQQSTNEAMQQLMRLTKKLDDIRNDCVVYERNVYGFGDEMDKRSFEPFQIEARLIDNRFTLGEYMSALSKLSTPYGFYNIRKIMDKSQDRRIRFLWTFLLLCCLALLGYQLWDRLSLYVSTPTHTRIVKQSVRDMQFPSVTVCNLNSYKLTEVHSLGLYPLIHSAVTNLRRNTRVQTLPSRSTVIGMPYHDFVEKASHKKADFIQRCYWNGVSCSHQNFTEFYDLDQGHCFTFTPHPHARVISRPGSASGLSLLLNVEQYEYVLGRVTSVGVKALVHDRGTYPRLHTDGVNAAVGSYTSMTIDKIKRREQRSCSACGQAGKNPDEVTACIREYHYDLTRRRCGCELSQAKHGLKACSVFDYFSCVINLREEARDSTQSRACMCHSACSRTEYDLSISEASMSVYAAESWMKSQHDVDEIEKRFQAARDTYHKVDKVIFSHDRDTLNLVVQGLTNCSKNISMLSANVSTYAYEYESARRKLTQNIITLNDTVNGNVDDFRRSQHVKTFVDLIPLARDKFLSIKDTKETLLKNIHSKSFLTVNETLSRILRQIDYLVIEGNSGWSNPRAFIDEIKKAVNRFREDILISYGQSYREFKLSRYKDELQARVDNILNLTEDIAKELLLNYNLISKTTQSMRKTMSQVQIEKLLETIERFYSDIAIISQGRYVDLSDQIKALSAVYEKQKKGVLDLADLLKRISSHLKIDGSTAGEMSKHIRKSVNKLNTNISTLQVDISRSAESYLKGKASKSALAKALQEGELSTVMSLATRILEELKDTLKTNHQNGDDLVTLIEPIKTRLVDFRLLSTSEVSDLIEKLKSPGIGRLSGGIVEMVEKQFSKIADYQNDLKEYLLGTRINGKFYQNNFLQIEFYFPEMVETTMYQEQTYGIFALASDIGASLSLYLGASILTVFGLVDLLLRSRQVS